jgi:hypothetical protein
MVGSNDRSETMKIEVWGLDPRSNSLVLWASSQSIWRSKDALHRIHARPNTAYPAAQAYCEGIPVKSMNTPTTSITADTQLRWPYRLAVPVYLESVEYGRLPVGSVVVSSNRNADQCGFGVDDEVLSRTPSYEAKLRRQTQVIEFAKSLGQDVLSPAWVRATKS